MRQYLNAMACFTSSTTYSSPVKPQQVNHISQFLQTFFHGRHAQYRRQCGQFYCRGKFETVSEAAAGEIAVLVVNIDEVEASNLANHLGKTREAFDEAYISKGESGRMVINSIPCHFLVENSCSVYEYRFAGCREFPAFHVPDFNKRLFTTYMHYDRCPIIFNVIETLKEELGFEKS